MREALPLAWIVVRSKKGYVPQNTHVHVVQQVQCLIPAGRKVVFLGDCEFDDVRTVGLNRLPRLEVELPYRQNTLVYSKIDVASGSLGTPIHDHVEEFGLKPRQGINYQTLCFTGKKYGLIQTGVAWETGHEEPTYSDSAS